MKRRKRKLYQRIKIICIIVCLFLLGRSMYHQFSMSGNGGVHVSYYSQKDSRWANLNFGGSTIAKSGCGPTSMSICISTLLKKTVTPVTTCKWAAIHGYYVKGSGWSHTVIPALAKHYGLNCEGIGDDKQKLIRALKEKQLVVAIMKKGHFTQTGHYIVLRGMTKNGKILVADCGDRKRNGAWNFDTIYEEARSEAGAGGPFWIISTKD